MTTRKITGIEDTIVAGSLLTPQALSQYPSSSGSPSRESLRLPGALLIAGRYELLGLVGVGGMGSVYRARDTELDEVIALKVLRRELVDAPGMLDRFRREVKLARRVTHRNVARTFDIGEHDGERFLTMEFIEGESLARLLEREGTLPLPRIIELLRAVCAGLTAAHAAGVVHRDLKPDNVLIATDGRLAITDFGVARASIDAANPQQTQGLPVGTPAYMAPEQVEGADTDARTDVYAVGAILFELVTGELAWNGPSPYSVAAARLLSPPPDPRDRRSDVDDAVAAVALRCMARDREKRYATADDLAAALTALEPHLKPEQKAEIKTDKRPTRSYPDLKAAMKIELASARPVPMADPMGHAVRKGSSAPSPREVGKVVAVLPFQNRGEADDEYLADGLTEDLIDALSMTDGLKVRPRGMVMKLKGSKADSRELGRELGVQVVVEGSFRKVGDVLRIAARLVSVADGFQLWARRFEQAEKEYLAIVDEAANLIAESLTVMRVQPSREGPPSTSVVDLYLRARHEYHKGWSTNVARAVGLFEEALKRAPNDPRVLAGYALAQMRRLVVEESSEGAAHVALRAAERARAAAPHAGEPQVALANYHFIMGDAEQAAREVNDALRIAPSLPDVHDLCGRILVEVGRPEEGMAMLERALLLEPSLYRAKLDLARVAALQGDWSRAEALYEQPPHEPIEHTAYWFPRARLALWNGDAVWAEWAKLELAQHTFAMRPALEGVCELILTRKMPEALRALVDDLGKITGRVRRRPIFFRQLKAEVHAYIGENDAALLALDEAATLGLIDVVWLDRCPLFTPLRRDERFAGICARVETRAARVLDAFM